MAKSNCKKGFVEVPRMTLNALKGLLFTNENGVDLSTIINDLKPNPDDELTAINVGLVYNGLTPEIDKATRFVPNYDELIKYEFVGISLILGVVKVKVSTRRFDNYNKYEWGEWKTENVVNAYGYDQWLEWNTDENAVMKTVEEKFPKPTPQTAE